MTELIEVPLGCGLGWAYKEACVTWGKQCRHLVNASEPSMCGGDVMCPFSQITLTTYYYYKI